MSSFPIEVVKMLYSIGFEEELGRFGSYQSISGN